VELERLLWVRCGEAPRTKPSSHQAADRTPPRNAPPARKPATGYFWRHPREQMRGIENAIPSVMQPGAVSAPESARIHVVARCAGEEGGRARQLPRRGMHARRPWLPPAGNEAESHSRRSETPKRATPWKRLEQALASTDLLLHGGGWGVVVLD